MAQRAIAVTEAEKRATAQAQTEIEWAEAQNVALVAGSQAALANSDTDAALTLAWQAVTLNPDSALAQAQLSEVAYTPGTIRRLVGHTDCVSTLAISPDGPTVLSGSDDKTVILWNLETGEILKQLEGHTTWLDDVAFGPDGQMAASVSDEMTILWDVKFSPDGSAVLASYSKGSLVMWDVETGAEIGQLVGHVDAGVVGLTFSADGQRVVSGGFDSQAILWDMETRSIVRGFTNHAGPIGQVGFTPDEHLMLGRPVSPSPQMVRGLYPVDSIARPFSGIWKLAASCAVSPITLDLSVKSVLRPMNT